jgi:hypothetical protein
LLQHRRFAPRNGDRQRLAIGCPKFNEASAVSLQAADHDPILVAHRRFLLPHSSSASQRFALRYSFFLFDQVVIAVTDSLSVAA